MEIDCTLCKKPIDKYHPEFNHLEIDDSHAIDVCPECVDKLIKWQQRTFAKLFPTKAMKERYGKI
ncbi:MAG: hypothetical protein PHG85_03120 [Candidatus Altiarchaeota archaeon]|nr:hypothetical protein [Candidatus Altiarchaeota archaeon]